ncbi:MAG: gliding motility-associated C-terminal domain-containing protein [Bacteroidia bacterium]|nr:gliding motility-associated C-terminal domain-containing protein [Bacteroidia bacterium]
MRWIARNLFFIYLTNTVLAQSNLVPNASFESYSTCPAGGPGLYTEPLFWFNPTANSPDYYHQCNNSLTGTAGVPCNWTGCQNARMGVAYSGCGFYYTTPNGREYIEVKLTEPLKAGRRYCIEFWVSLAGRSIHALDRIGAYLSVDSVYSNDLYVLPYQPQVENPQGNTISDTTNWVLVSGLFLASGGEKYLTIGNFYPDSLTQIDSVYPFPGIWSYYYIDDVSVTCCDVNNCEDTEPEFFIPTAISPNGDGYNDVWRLPGAKPESMDLALYDRWGNEVFRTTDPNFAWDGSYNGMELSSGVYCFYLKGILAGKELFEKGNLTIVR